MIIRIELDVTIDGECSQKRLQEAISKLTESIPMGVMSEDVDGTDDYALLVDSIETEIIRGNR